MGKKKKTQTTHDQPTNCTHTQKPQTKAPKKPPNPQPKNSCKQVNTFITSAANLPINLFKSFL